MPKNRKGFCGIVGTSGWGKLLFYLTLRCEHFASLEGLFQQTQTFVKESLMGMSVSG
jgi:hypothetical protein